jgi:scyllo-inositol 2-dehydrogenase (NADP+)
MERIGAAIIGYGLAGAVFHAPLIAAVPALEVRAIVTANPARRRQAAADFPQARLVAAAEDLWADHSGIGLVVVATPNRLHAAHAIAALQRGLAVVVDKPMALSSQEAQAMIDAAERAGAPLAVFHNRRYDNDFLLLRRLIAEDRLGGVLRLEARFERFRPQVSAGSWREATTPEEGGGLLLDLGSHLIDQALLLLGRPSTVYAEIARLRPGAAADDDCFLALRYAEGTSAHLWMTNLAPSAAARWRVWGLRAALEVWGLDPQEAQSRGGLRPGAPGFGEPDGSQRAILTTGGRDGAGQEVPLPAGRARDFYVAMAEAIQGKEEVPVPARAGLDVLAVVEAARRSAATGAVVPALPPQ